jgi:hypothetical protein
VLKQEFFLRSLRCAKAKDVDLNVLNGEVCTSCSNVRPCAMTDTRMPFIVRILQHVLASDEKMEQPVHYLLKIAVSLIQKPFPSLRNEDNDVLIGI